MVKSGRLTANTGSWSPTPRFSYQWFRNGATISGATSRTYSLQQADWGKKISVRVTGTVTGYTTVAKTSAARSDWVKAQSTYGTYSGLGLYRECISWGPDSDSSTDWQNVGDTYFPCDDFLGAAELYNSGSGMLIYSGLSGLPADIARYRLTFRYRTYDRNEFYFFATNLDVDEFTNGFTFAQAYDFTQVTSGWITIKDQGEIDFVISGKMNVGGMLYISSVTVEVERIQ
jgi:hypothetical protein